MWKIYLSNYSNQNNVKAELIVQRVDRRSQKKSKRPDAVEESLK
ncbi:hypothetical protein M595_4484 [Lyngbya aestuarii BL J]|uniref:Uncharacterized protein n=1 Tax=Lyngbya aestuarii BL J TaxID=1348334 RepID=U7QE84_9CYAN|nr:hypothetical protein [Lyngbya aestuarii]ERT05537.1 hypothetical protein M595_4484 [Lyngbya aestuarii BL J]